MEIHLSDENGGRGGDEDKRCLMEARLEGRQPIAVTHQAATVEAAMDGAANKLKRAIESTIGRRRDSDPLTDRRPPVTELSHVLCAVDFSEAAHGAFTRALALAAEHHAHLTVVYAVPLDQRFGARGRARMNTRSRLERLAEQNGVRLRVRVQQGEPAGIILLHANAKPFDLLVIGSHRRTGWERIRLGSVAERVVQQAACPVLIVAADEKGRRPTLGTVKSIVCPMDFTRVSTAAIATARSIVNETGSRLTLLHVLPALSSTSRFARDFVTRHRLTEGGRRRMLAALPPDVRDSPTVQTRVATGKPSDAIARVVTAVEADLVIMGVTARGTLGRRVIGSTAARVIGRTGCAVLAVPERTNRGRSPTTIE